MIWLGVILFVGIVRHWSALAIVALEIIPPGFNANQEVGWRTLGVRVPRAPKHE